MSSFLLVIQCSLPAVVAILSLMSINVSREWIMHWILILPSTIGSTSSNFASNLTLLLSIWPTLDVLHAVIFTNLNTKNSFQFYFMHTGGWVCMKLGQQSEECGGPAWALQCTVHPQRILGDNLKKWMRKRNTLLSHLLPFLQLQRVESDGCGNQLPFFSAR